MKSFVLGFGKFIFNCCIAIELIAIIAISISAGNALNSMLGNGYGEAIGYLVFVVLLIIFVGLNYWAYLFMDLCDTFKSISSSLAIIAKNSNTNHNTIVSTSNICPKCGKNNSKDNKFCEECGAEISQA